MPWRSAGPRPSRCPSILPFDECGDGAPPCRCRRCRWRPGRVVGCAPTAARLGRPRDRQGDRAGRSGRPRGRRVGWPSRSVPYDSPELHANDTLRAGAGACNLTAVNVLVEEARPALDDLIRLGCVFDRTDDGSLDVHREGGQSVARSVHSADATGREIMRVVVEEARKRAKRFVGTATRLLVEDGRCARAFASRRSTATSTSSRGRHSWRLVGAARCSTQRPIQRRRPATVSPSRSMRGPRSRTASSSSSIRRRSPAAVCDASC